jgi:hypothetical protein
MTLASSAASWLMMSLMRVTSDSVTLGLPVMLKMMPVADCAGAGAWVRVWRLDGSQSEPQGTRTCMQGTRASALLALLRRTSRRPCKRRARTSMTLLLMSGVLIAL